MLFKEEIVALLKKELKKDVTNLLEVPPEERLGDYALPCYKIAAKEAPQALAQRLAQNIKAPFLEKAEVKGPYLNFFVKRSHLPSAVLPDIIKKKQQYGSSSEGKGKTIVLEFSSPNIAKPFSIGHLRSTVIGNSLYHILSFLGYKIVRVNHLGDWGTQFGKLMCAYKHYGKQKELEKDPIQHLFNIYVKFHEEAEIHPELEEEARTWFKRLEGGDKEATELWELFRELSLKEFKKYYAFLEIDFESYAGESFYSSMLDDVVKEAKKKAKAEMSEGALVVKLDEQNMPPLILKKSDGASTYHTRDLAAALYRLKTYKPAKILYVVGAPQKLHFKQLFTVLEMMGREKDAFVHIDFGHFTGMSTRKGNIIFLEEVLDKAVDLAQKIIEEKNPALKKKKEVAKMVGLGAVIFADLSADRTRDVIFDWKKVISFEGETGPYLQYTHARCTSILRKAATKARKKPTLSLLTTDQETALIKHLALFPQAVKEAATVYKPSIIAHYLLKTAALFNVFYEHCPILKETEDLRNARLIVVEATKTVLATGLDLLGMKAPDEM